PAGTREAAVEHPVTTVYRLPSTVSAGGEITATLTLPPGAIREATRARVVLSGSPAGLMLRSLTYLHSIDYGNTENVVGWFLPDMTVAMALRELGVHWAPLEQGLPRRVHDNLSRLYALQAQEGGWGWNGDR